MSRSAIVQADVQVPRSGHKTMINWGSHELHPSQDLLNTEKSCIPLKIFTHMCFNVLGLQTTEPAQYVPLRAADSRASGTVGAQNGI